MTHLVMSKDDFEKELRVVMEERRWRIDDRPHSLMHERLMATALLAHPYRQPVIGWMSDLQHMELEDARAWYRHWYAPNNALLVVVGDVTGEEVLLISGVSGQQLGALMPSGGPLQQSIGFALAMAQAALAAQGPTRAPPIRKARQSSETASRRSMARPGWPRIAGLSTPSSWAACTRG